MSFVLALLLFLQAEPPAGGAAPDAAQAEPGGDPAQPAVADPANPPAGKGAEEPAGSDEGEPSPAPSTDPKAPGWLSDMLHSGAMGYMIEGGIFMWPLLVMAVIALGVIIERFRALMMLNTRAEELRQQVRGLLESDRIEEALSLCDREQGPVPAILAAGLRKYLVAHRLGYDAAKIEEQVVKGMDDYSIHIVAAMEKHLPALATISSAAPMIGFLGTVQGMVISFDDIVAKMGEMNIVQAAAAGIKVSLLTTVLGLIVGIPAFVAFNYFNNVINQFILDVEESASELIESVTMQLALVGRRNQPVSTESPSA
ncbi:MAG: MotA/TolQ/ExbB proton channel family protein [Planctomycetota bacterium]|nr:MotA/TolQ/ExbB proton channel family protein [Planctomycetota bacterium]